MTQISFLPYALFVGLLLFIVIIIGSCAVRSKPEAVTEAPEPPQERGLDIEEPVNSSVLVRSIPLESEAVLLLKKLALGEESGLKDQCVLLSLTGVQEENGRNIGIRVFLSLPGADQQTSYKTPHFVTSFSLGHSDRTIPGDFLFNLKNTIAKLGETLLQDLNQGELYFTLVPYFYFPKKGETPDDIKLRVAELNLVLDCD